MTSHLKPWKRVLLFLAFIITAALFLLLPLALQSRKHSIIIFVSNAKQVGLALYEHHDLHGVWPPSLKEIDPSLNVTPSMLAYPSTPTFPRALKQLPNSYPVEEWLYFPPSSDGSSHIILAAPLPYKKSDDKLVRIVVYTNASTELLDEVTYGRIIEKQSRIQPVIKSTH